MSSGRIGIPGAKIDLLRLATMLSERFPDVAPAVVGRDMRPPYRVLGALARATVQAIGEGNVGTVGAHFAFVDDACRDGDADVQNALGVAYLEHIDFDGRRARAIDARSLLTPRLAREIESLNPRRSG